MTATPSTGPVSDNDVDELVESESPRALDGARADVATPTETITETDLPSSPDNYQPTVRPRDDTPTRSDRIKVLRWLFLLVAIGGAGAMAAAVWATDAAWERVERVLVLVVSPVIALLASGIGWYFGKHGK